MKLDLYTRTCLDCSKRITLNYSTSFSSGVHMLHPRFHDEIYAIYGFVRFADEIVDTFHDANKAKLLEDFKNETFEAIYNKVSLNPVLHSFQWTVNKHSIDHELIHAFLYSMQLDLTETNYSPELFATYIYGSAEVVGLMCLSVFCDTNIEYQQLIHPARKLGEAFQKVNFLRDIKSDYIDRGRNYFPNINFNSFSEIDKNLIVKNITKDFVEAYEGIYSLNADARKGVFIAYLYYLELLTQIKNTPYQLLLTQRIRVPGYRKVLLAFKTNIIAFFGIYPKPKKR